MSLVLCDRSSSAEEFAIEQSRSNLTVSMKPDLPTCGMLIYASIFSINNYLLLIKTEGTHMPVSGWAAVITIYNYMQFKFKLRSNVLSIWLIWLKKFSFEYCLPYLMLHYRQLLSCSIQIYLNKKWQCPVKTVTKFWNNEDEKHIIYVYNVWFELSALCKYMVCVPTTVS